MPLLLSTPIKKIDDEEQRVVEHEIVDSDFWQSIITVIRKDGSFRVACRLSELLRSKPGVRRTAERDVDDLDFEQFLLILEADHDFDRDGDEISWHEQHVADAERPYVIENGRQWRAVIAHMTGKRGPVKFTLNPK